jgi:hypothetical protein
MALPHATPTAIASVEIHPSDIFASKHCLIVAARIGNTISDAILITITYRTDIWGFERPDGVKQTFFVQNPYRFDGLGRCDYLEVERAIDFSRQLWVGC